VGLPAVVAIERPTRNRIVGRMNLPERERAPRRLIHPSPVIHWFDPRVRLLRRRMDRSVLPGTDIGWMSAGRALIFSIRLHMDMTKALRMPRDGKYVAPDLQIASTELNWCFASMFPE